MTVDVRVVAAAIVRDGRVLAARRTRPAALAGGWEFPGGKVEPGEDGPGALARECGEELGVQVDVGAPLATVRAGAVTLELYAAALTGGEPRALQDHDELRWLDATGLPTVRWLPIDARLLPVVAQLLRDPGRGSTV